jgi:hypothetical protein
VCCFWPVQRSMDACYEVLNKHVNACIYRQPLHLSRVASIA